MAHAILTSRRFLFFFFNDPATTEIYTLSLHDALPILVAQVGERQQRLLRELEKLAVEHGQGARLGVEDVQASSASSAEDRKSTRLNSSHPSISYAVFCLKKKKKQ